MADPLNVARFLLDLAGREPEPEPITQMRLHKLLYYVQGWSLAQRGRPMFAGRIEAWTHGPVVRELYPTFRDFGDAPISLPEDGPAADLEPVDRAFVESIWESYKGYSATKLRAMTHHELPWQTTRDGLADDEKSDREIPQDLMADFFREEYARRQVPGLELDRIREAEEDIAAGRYVEFDEAFERV